MLPLYKQMSTWGLMDSYVAVVLPFLAHASTIFFFRQYLLGTPKSLIEAGRIDGATEYGIFFRLIVPILKPAFSAMAILNWYECMEQLHVAITGYTFFQQIYVNNRFEYTD